MNRAFRPLAEHHLGCLRSVVLLACVFVGQAHCLAQNLPASETPIPDLQGRIISAIQIQGNDRVSTVTILAVISSQTGQPYNSSTINQDIKAVQRLRGIQAVVVTAKADPDRLVLIFHVTEHQIVRSIELAGNRRFSDEELTKFLMVKEGDFADHYLLTRGAEAIARHYRQSGYHRVKVSADPGLLTTQAKVIYRIVEGPRTRVSKVIFQGNRQVSSRKLRGQIRTKPHTLIFYPGNLDREMIESDVDHLSLYLREEGYLDARVDTRLEFSADQEWVTITFLIGEGPLYKVRQVRFIGNQNLSSPALVKVLKISPGDVPVKTAVSRTNTQRILEAYGRKGYVDAQVRVVPTYVREQPGLVDLVYNIDEGPQYRVGRIDVLGNEVTQDRVIRRQLLLVPQDIYNATKMQRSRTRLLESGLFDQVNVSDVSAPGDLRDIKIDVHERPTATLLMGVGVTSDAGVVGDFSFIQRNFDLFGFPSFRGAGQYLRLQAQPGTELSRFAIDFREPYVADLPISFGQSIYLRGRFREDYDEDRLGALWSLGMRFGRGWEIEGALRLEQVTIRDIDADTAAEILAADGDHDLTSAQATIIRDRTDSIFLPSQGDIFSISYEQFGIFSSDESFGRLEAKYAWYFTTHTDSLDRKSILSLRTKVGTIIGDAPFFERYYAGGTQSIRGFDFRGVSPRTPSVVSGDAVVVGSDWLVLAGAEYSFPLIGETLRGAAFLDSAAVDDGPYRLSAGLSIRLMVPYFAPIPLSADFAWPLNKDNDDDTRVFSFSFATSFY